MRGSTKRAARGDANEGQRRLRAPGRLASVFATPFHGMREGLESPPNPLRFFFSRSFHAPVTIGTKPTCQVSYQKLLGVGREREKTQTSLPTLIPSVRKSKVVYLDSAPAEVSSLPRASLIGACTMTRATEVTAAKAEPQLEPANERGWSEHEVGEDHRLWNTRGW